MTIKKVKYHDSKVEIHYALINRAGKETEYIVRSDEEPSPDFVFALEKMKKHVREICEFDGLSLQKIKVLGVSFSYGGETNVMGAVITAQKILQYSPQPLNINTPHKIEEFYSKNGDEMQLMSDEMKVDLYELQQAAEDYIDGERAQQDLFKDQEK